MKAIINAYNGTDLAKYNGLTFDIVGHFNGNFLVQIDNEIIEVDIGELFVVDIQFHYSASLFRLTKVGFDYWFDFLTKYLKEHKIKPLGWMKKEMPATITKIKEPKEETINFETIDDNNLFS